VGVGGDQLGLVDAGGGVDYGVRGGEAMLEAGVGGGQGDGLIQGDDAAQEHLGREPVGQGSAAMLGQVFVDLEDDHCGDEHGGIALEVTREGRRLGVFRQVLEPARGIDEIKFRTAPLDHDIRLSI